MPRYVFLFSLGLLIVGCVNNNTEPFPVRSEVGPSEADRLYLSYKTCQQTSECMIVSNACTYPDAINRSYKSEFFARAQKIQPYVNCDYKRFDFSKVSTVCNVGKCEVLGKSEAEIDLP